MISTPEFTKESKARARAKAWRLAHPERQEAAIKRWVENNPESVKAIRARSKQKHRAKIIAANHAYYEKNKARILENERAWSTSHRGAGRRYRQTRRGRLNSLLHPDHDIIVESLLHAECIKLTSSTGIIHEVDHIIPISKGGWHHHKNIQILPRSINRSKCDNPFWELCGYKSWKDVPKCLWPESLFSRYDFILNNLAVA